MFCLLACLFAIFLFIDLLGIYRQKSHLMPMPFNGDRAHQTAGNTTHKANTECTIHVYCPRIAIVKTRTQEPKGTVGTQTSNRLVLGSNRFFFVVTVFAPGKAHGTSCHTSCHMCTSATQPHSHPFTASTSSIQPFTIPPDPAPTPPARGKPWTAVIARLSQNCLVSRTQLYRRNQASNSGTQSLTREP